MHTFVSVHQTFEHEIISQVSPRPVESSDFSSDDSVRDKTFAPGVNNKSFTVSSSSFENIVVQETDIHDVAGENNRRRKRQGTNIRKIIREKRNKENIKHRQVK